MKRGTQIDSKEPVIKYPKRQIVNSWVGRCFLMVAGLIAFNTGNAQEPVTLTLKDYMKT